MVQFNDHWLTLEGHTFPAILARIEPSRITGYLDFLGYGDDPAVEALAFHDVGALLPTLPFSLEMDAGVVATLANLLGIPSRFLLHAEQRFDYHSPLQSGDLVTVEACLRKVNWKPEKQLCFFEKETHFLVDHALVVNSLSIYAVRARENLQGAGTITLE